MPRRWRMLLSDDWPILPFQPILYFALFLGTIHVTLLDRTPIPFEEHFVPGFTYIWAGLMIGSTLMSALSAWMILRRTGKTRYAGFWVRFGSDFGVLCGLLAFDVATWSSLTDENIFRHFVFGSVGTFVGFLVVRDVVKIVLAERLATRLHRKEPTGE